VSVGTPALAKQSVGTNSSGSPKSNFSQLGRFQAPVSLGRAGARAWPVKAPDSCYASGFHSQGTRMSIIAGVFVLTHLWAGPREPATPGIRRAISRTAGAMPSESFTSLPSSTRKKIRRSRPMAVPGFHRDPGSAAVVAGLYATRKPRPSGLSRAADSPIHGPRHLGRGDLPSFRCAQRYIFRRLLPMRKSRTVYVIADKLGVRRAVFYSVAAITLFSRACLRSSKSHPAVSKPLDLRGVTEFAAFEFPPGRPHAYSCISASPGVGHRRLWAAPCALSGIFGTGPPIPLSREPEETLLPPAPTMTCPCGFLRARRR